MIDGVGVEADQGLSVAVDAEDLKEGDQEVKNDLFIGSGSGPCDGGGATTTTCDALRDEAQAGSTSPVFVSNEVDRVAELQGFVYAFRRIR